MDLTSVTVRERYHVAQCAQIDALPEPFPWFPPGRAVGLEPFFLPQER